MRRSLVFLVVAVLVLVSLAGGASRAASGNPAPTARAGVTTAAVPPAPRILVLGDSISQGFEGDYTWRYRLKQHLASTGVAADFVGPYGGTNALSDVAVDGPPRFDGSYRSGVSFPDSQHMARWGWQANQAMWDIAGATNTYSPDVILVALGFNDLGWRISGADGTVQAVRSIINNARAAKPGVPVLVANVAQRSPIDSFPTLPSVTTDYNAKLAAMVASVNSQSNPTALVDVAGVLSHSRDTYDGLHPNVRGEYVIAKQFADQLASRLGVGAPFGALPTSFPADLAPSATPTLTAVRDGFDINLSWSRVFGASGFMIRLRDVTSGEPFRELPFPIGAQSFVSRNMAAGHQFEFRVVVKRGTWTGATSAVASAQAKSLAAVQNVRVAGDPDRPYTLTVTWDPVAEADDYAVYAMPMDDECQTYLWPDSAFKLNQFNLGRRTQWTQEYIFSLCVVYKVVALRNGGESARSAGKMGVPFANNYSHYVARQRFWDGGVDQGDSRLTSRVAPAGRDNGIIVARAFIRNNNSMNDLIGDHRGFDSNPAASAKIAIAYDTATGEIGIHVKRSCLGGTSWFYKGVNFVCHEAFPIVWDPDAVANSPDWDMRRRNFAGVRRFSDGRLEIQVSAYNSFAADDDATPSEITTLGRINALVVLEPVGNTYRARILGDKFPSWEVVRYPRTQVAWFGFSDDMWIGSRDQTSIDDLQGEPRGSVCESRPGEQGSFSESVSSRPMVCS